MKAIITQLLLITASPLHAHQWDISKERCQELAQGFSGAQQLDGRLMHEYLEGCELSQLPVLIENAIDAMQESIRKERIERGIEANEKP